MINATFRLDNDFVEKYRHIPAPFGFNGLGELVYRRTYSRIKDDGMNEEWFETIQRVVEGCYRMQERHIKSQDLGWSNSRAQTSAQEMYERMWNMRFLPPGRGLWAMGSVLTESKKHVLASLLNCSFISTKGLAKDPCTPFAFLMDMSMVGVGVGFDVEGAGKIVIHEPGTGGISKPNYLNQFFPQLKDVSTEISYQGIPTSFNYQLQPDGTFIIPDTREGWVMSLVYLLSAFFTGTILPKFDYSIIRPKGLPIKGFGGMSSGPEPLRALHEQIITRLVKSIGNTITITTIVDIMNMIGCCVVAGNVRRSSELVLGPISDEFMQLKDYAKNPERMAWGWASNNTIKAIVGMDYSYPAEQTGVNGEPGYWWPENVLKFGRMGELPIRPDNKVCGTNPCGEVSLESGELCNLVEVFPDKHNTLDDFKRTLKFAYLYAKTVTLATTGWRETNRIMLRNRRIGCSLSGLQQFVAHNGIDVLKQWCCAGYETVHYYDEVYSDWLCIPKSIKLTTLKPSGSISLLCGATPGIHWPEAQYYIRRVRIAKNSPVLRLFQEAGYPVEDSVTDVHTSILSIPVQGDPAIRSVTEVSVWEQAAFAAFIQKYWSDQQVSATLSFDPEREGGQIKTLLDYYQYQFKGVSFLPRIPMGAFPQMPYEPVTPETYREMIADIKPLAITNIVEAVSSPERFCSNDSCSLG